MTDEPRLSLKTLHAAQADGPSYDPETEAMIGVVHLGPGAFFRAHQAPVYEQLLAGGQYGWGVCGVSLHSPDVRDALQPQDGLYTLVRLGNGEPPQIVGALREVIVAPQEPARVLARLGASATHLVSLTVTEKGYHLTPAGDLDLDAPPVARDLKAEGKFETAVGWLFAGLKARRDSGVEPFLTLSCDNVSGNGGKLKRSVLAFARARGDERIADWIDAGALFPDSMVDSITPATTDALREWARTETGVIDAWPIQRESFAQWVIEAVDHIDIDELAAHGVTLTRDVAGYERAKLRLLNGAHSTLAYIGPLAGFETVSEAMGDARLADFVERLMREHLAPTVRPPEGLDVPAYIDAILGRFRNGAIRHRLAQIAADGSQKLPIRILAPAAEALKAGAPVAASAVPLAAWMRFALRAYKAGETIADPLATTLAGIAAACTGDAQADVDRFLEGLDLVPAPLRDSPAFRAALIASYAALGRGDPLGELQNVPPA